MPRASKQHTDTVLGEKISGSVQEQARLIRLEGENYISPKRKLLLMEKCSRQQLYWMEVMLDYLSP